MKSNMSSTKTTVLPKPETTIEATVKVTVIINDQMSKEQALDLIKDMINDQPDAFGNEPNFDHVEYQNVKVFQRGV